MTSIPKSLILSLVVGLCFAVPFAGFAEPYGDGVKADELGDYKAAAIFYSEAAAQGHMMAQHRLGVFYINGQGVVQSDEQAAVAFQQAADQGLAEAQYALATLYFYGQGIPQSKEVAMIWLKKAAALGDLTARAQLKQLGIQ